MALHEKICCVPNCGKTRANDTILHSFPNPNKDRERFLAWRHAIGPTLSSLNDQYIYKYRKVCHSHFDDTYLTWSRRLSRNAVPTKLIPGIQAQRCPMMDITNTVTSRPRDKLGETSNRSQTTNTAPKNMPFLDDRKAMQQTIYKLSKKKQSYAGRLKSALNLGENKTFQNAIKKFTTLAALFTVMQFREIKKNKMGRRFTQSEKIMALSLYKRSPRTYRWLKSIFVLPSPLTLSRLITKANLRPGINENIFKQLKKKTKNMKEDDKLCILLFDEVSIIAPHFDYNLRNDVISGFVNDGDKRQNNICNHSLVFMIRGIQTNYKQPVSYTFCSGTTNKNELAKAIKNVIRKLHSVGLRVLATVCDQGTSNVSAVNILLKETREKENKEYTPYFLVDDEKVVPLYDPPHLIKGIRNNLLEKDLKCTIDGSTKIAKWDHVIQLHNEDPAYKGIRLVKKLSEQHIKPDNFQKMKVKYATQVISQRVAVTMGYLAENKNLPQECTQTADVFLFFDALFDSMNGSFENSKKRGGKALLQAVTPRSEHRTIWSEALNVLGSMKFIIKHGPQQGKEVTVPTVNNWIQSIKRLEYLTNILSDNYNMKSLWMRHFNQDPLEIFFGLIRSHGSRNINPTPAGFESSFAALLISNLSGQHAVGSNCEADSCKSIFKTMGLLFHNNRVPVSNETTEVVLENIYDDFDVKEANPKILAQLQYVSGYVLRKANIKIFRNCKTCTKCLYDEKNTSTFLKMREYNKRKCLTYADENIVKSFSKIQDIATYILKNYSIMSDIKAYMKMLIYSEVDFDFMTCKKHTVDVVECFVELSCRFFIFNWCRDINKILNGGKLEENDYGDEIKLQAANYCAKKRHNKKKT